VVVFNESRDQPQRRSSLRTILLYPQNFGSPASTESGHLIRLLLCWTERLDDSNDSSVVSPTPKILRKFFPGRFSANQTTLGKVYYGASQQRNPDEIFKVTEYSSCIEVMIKSDWILSMSFLHTNHLQFIQSSKASLNPSGSQGSTSHLLSLLPNQNRASCRKVSDQRNRKHTDWVYGLTP
jgi:hypothetical protein